MIRIKKPSEPQILTDNKQKWTQDLEDAVLKYGGYNLIPKEEREKLLIHYRHKEIQKTLFDASHEKCAFCESKPAESGNIEVEHFAPKSIHYKRTFDWENLLPSCRKCNEAKGTHDTEIERIVDPCNVNPEEYFEFNSLNIVAANKSPDKIVSERTIEVCNLNSLRLYKSRADLLYNLHDYEKQLDEWIHQVEESDTERKKKNRLVKLCESIDRIEVLAETSQKYSAFSKNFLNKSNIYLKAKELRKELQGIS